MGGLQRCRREARYGRSDMEVWSAGGELKAWERGGEELWKSGVALQPWWRGGLKDWRTEAALRAGGR